MGHGFGQALHCWRRHCTFLSGKHYCTKSAEGLAQGVPRLLNKLLSLHSTASANSQWRLYFRGQPWWPSMPRQKTSKHSRSQRALADSQGVDLVVTVNVPAGQNSSEATSSIEGPAFAPSLQQSLVNAGVLSSACQHLCVPGYSTHVVVASRMQVLAFAAVHVLLLAIIRTACDRRYKVNLLLLAGNPSCGSRK